MEKIKKICYFVLNIMLYWVALLMPKNKNVWVFGSWFGKKFNDSPKALYEYVTTYDESIKAVWITKDKVVLESLRNKDYLVYYYLSIKGIYFQLRAGKSFVSTSVHDDLYAPCIGPKTTNVQLWHGIPLKKIMFDTYSEEKGNQNIYGKIEKLLTPYNKHRNDYLTVTSVLTQKVMAGAFRLPIEKTIITGFPRNDVFLSANINNDKNRAYRCIYMPTHRGGDGGNFDLFQKYDFDIQKIDKILCTNEIELTLRLHPFNAPSNELMKQISKSKMIRMDITADIYETISSYDCLITDYSSIYFDFLLTDRPIIFSAFDLEIYKQNERELYFEFDDVTLKPNCLNWTEVIDRLIGLKENGISEDYRKAYLQLKERFHEKGLNENEKFSKKIIDKLHSLQ